MRVSEQVTLVIEGKNSGSTSLLSTVAQVIRKLESQYGVQSHQALWASSSSHRPPMSVPTKDENNPTRATVLGARRVANCAHAALQCQGS